MSLNQQNASPNNSSFKKRAGKSGKKNTLISLPTNNKSTVNLINSSTINENSSKKFTCNLLQSIPCSLTSKVASLSNGSVLSNVSTSPFNANLSMFSSHDTTQNLSTHQLNAINLSTQQYKVSQKNSQFYLMPANLAANTIKPTTNAISNFGHFFKLNELNTIELKKRILNEELLEILNELKKLALQLESKIAIRSTDINLIIKQELLNQLDRIYKCLKQDDYEDQYDEEEADIYNSELISLNQLKKFNSYNNDLNNPITSLNSPLSINSPSASSPSTNYHQDLKQDEEEKDDVSFSNTFNRALNFNLNYNESSSGNMINDNNQLNTEDDLDTQQITFGDQFIIDNRKNMNQNRIKSSILGAVKHLSNKKRQQEQTQLSFSDDNNSAINLTIRSSVASNSISEPQLQEQQSKSKCICHLCNQTFTQRNSLNRHIRGHTGEKPFPCTTCGKSFSDKQRLLIHHRIHSGEKPFSCSLCKRSFTQKSTVKRHLIVHFGQESNMATLNPNFNNALNLKRKTKSKKSVKGSRKRKLNQTGQLTVISSANNEQTDTKNEE